MATVGGDFSSNRGEQFVLDGAITKNGAPYPIAVWAGHTVLFTAKRKRTDAGALVAKDNLLRGGVTLGANGTGLYTVEIDTVDTAAFTETELLIYDVQLIEPDGARTVVAKGTWRVRAAVGS